MGRVGRSQYYSGKMWVQAQRGEGGSVDRKIRDCVPKTYETWSRMKEKKGKLQEKTSCSKLSFLEW
jgi:hypothetical protein